MYNKIMKIWLIILKTDKDLCIQMSACLFIQVSLVSGKSF